MDAISIIVKSTVVLSTFLLIYHLFLNKDSHFNNSRAFLLAGLLLTFTIPFFNITYTVYAQINTPNIPQTVISTESAIPQTPNELITPIKKTINWQQIMLWAYIAITTLLTLRLLGSLLYGLWLSKSAEVVNWRSTKIYLHPSVKNPMVFGKKIFVKDKSYLLPDKVQILLHEEVHKNHNHWVDIMAIELLSVLAWFNPVAFFYKKAVLNNLEYIADRGVLDTGLQLNTYIQSILCETMGAETIMLANHFRTSQNKQRLKMMKNVKQSKLGKFKLLLILPIIGGLCWAFSEPEYVPIEKQRRYVDYEDIKHEKTDSIKFSIHSKSGDTLEVRQTDGTYKRMIVAGQTKNAKLTIKNKTITEIPLPLGSIDLKVNVGDTLIGSADNHLDKQFVYNGQGNTFLHLNPDNRILIKGVAYISDTLKIRKDDGTYNTQIIMGDVSDVNVIIKGTSLGTYTDKRGNFEIKVNKGDILVFSHVGYMTKEYKYTGQEKVMQSMEYKTYDELPYNYFKEKYDSGKLGTKDNKIAVGKMALPNGETFVAVETVPEYKDGMDIFFLELFKKAEQTAKSKGIKGVVNVVFNIDTEGNSTIKETFGSSDTKVISAAKNIINDLNNWTPATQRGKKMPYTYCVKVEF